MLFALLGFGVTWDPPPLSSFLFLPFGVEVSILYVSHYCILKANNLFGFMDSQLERVKQTNRDLNYIELGDQKREALSRL